MVDDNIADVADIQGVKDYQLSACDVRMVDDNYITSPMWYVSSQLYQTVAGRLTGSKGLPAECLWCKDVVSCIKLWQADLQGVKDYQLSACGVRMVDDNYITSRM
ncbi:hypothetical protein J6590_059224 [Homalodisca vitripennis]|nr:hypothetical protein J6590_059224 [Homalodisca vitripennis]